MLQTRISDLFAQHKSILITFLKWLNKILSNKERVVGTERSCYELTLSKRESRIFDSGNGVKNEAAATTEQEEDISMWN